ncbi:auxin-responsive protein SAUR71-like [Phoenix dactylifera]|uniref:Auxin-responsive protein SAUR71-like n=1 Tax=Phoenix dactylifera TaxID=42345 RepID=A0A8B7CQY2_PHODC|nr:auxin-responsive protein SAUR71-like [Phoenix dactylifera]
MGKEKGKKGLILKTLERCRSIGGHRKEGKRHMAPEGCFAVYVGPGKERFVVRMECINHPLFQMLLDEAEMEYGYATEGPLELPCNVELFNRVLWEMEQELVAGTPKCSFTRSHSGYRLLSPSRPMVIGRY